MPRGPSSIVCALSLTAVLGIGCGGGQTAAPDDPSTDTTGASGSSDPTGGSGGSGNPAGTGGTSTSNGTSGSASGVGGSGLAGSNASGSGGMVVVNTDAGAGKTPARPSAGCGKTKATGYVANNTINVKGADRIYALMVSATYKPDTPVSIVFSWHGSGGNGAGDRSGFEWNLEKNMTGIFVYPTAIDGKWSLAQSGNVDFDLYEALYTYMTDNYCVDLNRVFALGFSLGAMFTNTLACHYAGDKFKIRGASPQSGTGPSGTCTGNVAWLGTHGTTDGSVPFKGGQDSRDYWAKNNGCTATTMPYDPQPKPGPFMGDHQGTCVKYTGCKDGFPVHWCTFEGGHDWQEWTHFTEAAFFNALP